jgi:hypothetical protein
LETIFQKIYLADPRKDVLFFKIFQKIYLDQFVDQCFSISDEYSNFDKIGQELGLGKLQETSKLT